MLFTDLTLKGIVSQDELVIFDELVEEGRSYKLFARFSEITFYE
jgi:hypothetical protein